MSGVSSFHLSTRHSSAHAPQDTFESVWRLRMWIYLVEGTSWRLPPCPPAAAGSWGPGPGQRRRLRVRRHGDRGTEGQHPVGSMPAEEEREVRNTR